MSAPAERWLAPAVIEAVTWAATISPANSESATASAEDCAVAASPGCAETVARDRPRLTIEPSSGYWNDCTSALRFVGHVRSPSDTVSWPGIVTCTSTALAPVSSAPRRWCGSGEGRAPGHGHGREHNGTDHDEMLGR